MRKLIWKSSHDKKTPGRGSDEYFRHTIVLPWPFKKEVDEDGDIYYPAIILVSSPWWFCRDMVTAEARTYTRFQRHLHAELSKLGEECTDDEFDAVWEPLHKLEPPFPPAWEVPAKKKKDKQR